MFPVQGFRSYSTGLFDWHESILSSRIQLEDSAQCVSFPIIYSAPSNLDCTATHILLFCIYSGSKQLMMKGLLATLALAAVSLASPTNQAPDSFKIKNVVYGGSGCPQGSIDVDWTENGILPIYFGRQFTARVGPGKGPEESRKNCQINLSLDFSPGFSFAIFSADYTGWGELDRGVTGVVKSTYYFSGEQDQTSSALTISGPFDGKYYKQDNVAVAVWSPCGKDAMFNINSEVALTPFSTSANGLLTATKESGRFTTNLYVQWRKC